MDYATLKRTLQLDDFNNLSDSLAGSVMKKQKNGEVQVNTNDDDERGNNCEKSLQKKDKQTAEMRLEVNRQRARDIRRRNKIMTEEMQKQLVLLTMENNKLRMESQMQKEEITLLRKAAQFLESNVRPPAHTSLTPKGLSNSEIIDIIRGVSYTNDNLSGLLQPSRYPENIGFNTGASLQPNTVLSSAISLGLQTPENTTYPFGTEKQPLD